MLRVRKVPGDAHHQKMWMFKINFIDLMLASVLFLVIPWHTTVGVNFVADLRAVIRPTGTDNRS